jgi:hypothetical protein
MSESSNVLPPDRVDHYGWRIRRAVSGQGTEVISDIIRAIAVEAANRALSALADRSSHDSASPD